MPGELELLGDARQERPRRVEHGGAAKPGVNFLGHRAPAHDVARLEHQRLDAGAREHGRRDQAIVAGSDDDDVSLAARAHYEWSPRMRFAALRPGAPMIPPPGCVADPHM